MYWELMSETTSVSKEEEKIVGYYFDVEPDLIPKSEEQIREETKEMARMMNETAKKKMYGGYYK